MSMTSPSTDPRPFMDQIQPLTEEVSSKLSEASSKLAELTSKLELGPKLTELEEETRAIIRQQPVVAVLAALGVGYLIARLASGARAAR